MTSPTVTLEHVLRLLPRVEELEGLRLSILRAATPDPDMEWDSAREFATVDKRILTEAGLTDALEESEAALHQYVSELFAALRAVVHAHLRGEEAEAAGHLIGLGERQEAQGLYPSARRFLETALSLLLPLAEKEPQVLALRRIARVARSSGDYVEALEYYRCSAMLARYAGDLRGEVIASTGTGYVLALQGRWEEAERCHQQALARAESADDPGSFAVERAQLINNLAILAVRQGRLDEAEAWLGKARPIWAEASSAVDLAVCLHCEAQLRDAQERREESRALYRQALELDLPDAVRAGIAIDLAESHVKDGDTHNAESWARVAEEHAIAARSPYILGRVYHGRGNIARAARADDGFIFFEKALQIAREKALPLLEGETLADYALLRREMGGHEEAVSYLERAREIFAASGAQQEQRRVEERLREISGLEAETVPD